MSAPNFWFDFEAASLLDLKAVGTFRYAADASTRAIVLAYAIGDGPALAWHADGAILDWDHAPGDLRPAFDRGGTGAAWNASFDSNIWNYATLGFPFLAPERVIDPMIQAGVSNLPTDLEGASRALGGAGKQKDGKKLIKLFCVEGAAPSAYPEEWQLFLRYARRDVEEMRDAYRRTRPLPLTEWREYWAFERVNRRGVTVDMPFVRRAAALAAEDAVASGRRLSELTDGAVTRVTQAKRLAAWLHDQLTDAMMREVLTLGVPADDDGDDDDDQAEPHELSLTRDRVAHVLAMLEAKHANGGLSSDETKAREAATLRLYGAGASPKKFARIDAQQVDGVLRDQYRFNGAPQTGRLSSKSAQIHNLTRDVLGEDGAAEAPLVDAIADGCSYAALAAAEPVDVPVARKLALLVRPALVASLRKHFVWSDWSAIEARITPWLAASPGAEKVLDIFRAHDADPTRPDIYTIAAADILHKDPNAVTKTERGIGKVSTLALGFGGSIGALQRMALAYRIHLDDAEARRIVDAWREANSWAREFWGAHRDGESFGLWGAAMRAWEVPGQITTAGRIGFVYREDYLGGALFLALPSGRLLTYPRPKWRDVDVLGKDKKPTGEKRRELSFRRARGRAKLWHGTLAENCCGSTTQVLTAAGWKHIVDIFPDDLVFDGIEWVSHGGIAYRGVRKTAHLDGVPITANHRVLTRERGWTQAVFARGLHRAHVQLPESIAKMADDRQRDTVFGRWVNNNSILILDQFRDGIVHDGRFGEPVYDILNCGPRHQFVVRGDTGPFIVHNCTQAVAADILRETVTRIEANRALSWMPIRMTTHDEIVCEVDKVRAEEARAILRREMLTVPDWAAGLPLASEESVCTYYSKAKAALQGNKL